MPRALTLAASIVAAGSQLAPIGAAQQPAPPLFAAPMTRCTNDSPEGFAVGDLDGDGRPDVAGLLPGINRVAIRFGAGDGRFTTGPTPTVGSGPRAIVLADLEGDGDLDVATANSNVLQTITTLEGDGHGAFGAANFSTSPGSAGRLALADLDGDGDCDAVRTHTVDDTLSVLLGDGSGNFTLKAVKAAGQEPGDIVLADMDLDGDLDAGVSTNANHALVVLRGTGNASFGAPLIFGVPHITWSITSADFDGNGQPDLAAVVGVSNTAAILKSLPGSSFVLGPQVPLGVVGADGLVAGDVNEDGKPDLLASSNDGLSLVPGDGLGGFSAPQPGDGVPALGRIALADANGDGHVDAVLADDANSFTVVLGDGAGPPRGSVALDLPGGQFGLVLRDFDGDALPDIAVASMDPHHVALLPGAGDGSFGSPLDVAVDIWPRALASDDFDADGLPDLAVTCETPGVQVLIGAGDGSFSANGPFACGDVPLGLVTADFDLDGLPDAATADGGSLTSTILLGAGDGTLDRVGTLPFAQPPVGLVTADFDTDGVPDLIVAAGALHLLRGLGDGSFSASTLAGSEGGPALAAADFDGDGAADVVSNEDNGGFGSAQLRVHLGDGGGGFASPLPTDFEHGVVTLTVAELNGDGIPDLAAPAAAAAGVVNVLLGAGDGSFVSQGGFASAIYGSGCAAADLDGDGATDLVTSHSLEPSVTVLLNRRLRADYPWTDLGHGLLGAGEPRLTGSGPLLAGTPGALSLDGAAPSAASLLFLALTGGSAPFKGGTLVAWPALATVPLATTPAGELFLPWAAWPADAAGLELALQLAVADAGAPKGVSLSNGLRAFVP